MADDPTSPARPRVNDHAAHAADGFDLIGKPAIRDDHSLDIAGAPSERINLKALAVPRICMA